MLDIVIRGADVIDGTGAARRRADVGVAHGRVVEIGDLGDQTDAAHTIDATDRVVCPGFVDVHTHYDAQAFWDPTLSPSPLHGVTSVIGGNCGFSIAPLGGDPSNGDYLMRMLARVEGMPLEALEDGVPWNWASMGDYLDTLDGTLAINAGFKVGHSAVRRVTMGPDATRREATDDELETMKGLVREALGAGAIGFSSSWSRTHNDADGAMVPSRHGSRTELVELMGVCGEFTGTSLELIPQAGAFEPWAVELMTDCSVAAGRPLNWNVLFVNAAARDDAFRRLEAGDHARARGGRVVALTVPMMVNLRLSFAGGFILDAMPGWEEAMFLPRDEKLDLLADPERRRALGEAAASPDNPLRNLARWSGMVVFDTTAPENVGMQGRTIGEIADGRDPFDVLCEIVVADELTTSFGNPPADESDADWQARVDVWRDGRAVIGASDAGAHLDLFHTANFATEMLGEAVRRRGLLPLEEAVHLITDVPARLYGLRDRGRLEPGSAADIVILDETTIGTSPLQVRRDLPTGAPRLTSEAVGIDRVLCNGTVIVEDGAFTGARPGTILRSGRDTADPAMD